MIRRKRVADQRRHDEMTEPEAGTPAGVYGLLVEIRDLFRRMLRVAKWILVGAAVIVVSAAALQLQVSSRNEDIRATKVTSQEAKEAARDAKKAVEDAIAQSQTGNQAVDVPKLIEGLNAMTRVEQFVCGGPCPSG